LAEVQCWGQNWYGGLGIGAAGFDQNVGDEPDEVGGTYTDLGFDPLGTWYSTIAIGTGAYHTCAGVHDGNLKCWGLNDHGQLGHGDTANIGDEFGETGDGIPIVNVGN
jgi:alpha-tubulin suppressor-like RCC1 family protein